MTRPDPLLFQPSPLLSPPPAPNPHCKDLASIVLEFQYCSENEKPLNAIRGWGAKENLAPLGQLKMPLFWQNPLLWTLLHKGPSSCSWKGLKGGGVWGEEGGFQLKANSLL